MELYRQYIQEANFPQLTIYEAAKAAALDNMMDGGRTDAQMAGAADGGARHMIDFTDEQVQDIYDAIHQ